MVAMCSCTSLWLQGTMKNHNSNERHLLRSHLHAWTPLAHGLAMHGHQVTVVTDTPSTDPPPGLTEIVVTSKEFSSFQEDYSVFMLSDNKGVWDSLRRVMQGAEIIIKVEILLYGS